MQNTSPRRFRAYGVGMAKTGTHSLASMFSRFASAHEPRHEPMLTTILDRADNRITDMQQAQFLAQRDRELALEMDVSQLNYFVLDQLLALFPDAKFILTIRDCYSWLDSLINHQLGRTASDQWQRLRDLRFGGVGFHYEIGETALRKRGLYSLDGYLGYWSAHNCRVLQTVPRERLLVVRTSDLSCSLPALAAFLEISTDMLEGCDAHGFQAEKRFNLLAEIDPELLAYKVAEHCGPLMEAYFPAIGSLEKALASSA